MILTPSSFVDHSLPRMLPESAAHIGVIMGHFNHVTEYLDLEGVIGSLENQRDQATAAGNDALSEDLSSQISVDKSRMADMSPWPVFPAHSWEALLTDQDEAALLHVLGAFNGDGVGVYLGYVFSLCAEPLPPALSSAAQYSRHFAPVLGPIWQSLVSAAAASAEKRGVEYTRLMDRLTTVARLAILSFPPSLRETPACLGSLPALPSPESLPRTTDCLGTCSLEQAMLLMDAFPSREWRSFVLSSSAAVTLPEFLSKWLGSPATEPVDSLARNPHLGQEGVLLLQEWILASLLTLRPVDGAGCIATALESVGRGFTAEQVARVGIWLSLPSSHGIEESVSQVPSLLSREPLLSRMALASKSFKVREDALSFATGRVWLDGCLCLLKAMAPPEDPADWRSSRAAFGTLVRVLQKATPATVRGLSAADTVPLLACDDPVVRGLARPLMECLVP